MSVRRQWSLIAGSTALAVVTHEAPVSHSRADDIGVFVDSFMAAELGPRHIPGAAFVFVRDGRIVAMRGYGVSDVERKTPVVAESTIFRIGSISKVITAMAVAQLADRGRIHLDSNVARYVKRVAIPSNYPQPISVEHLLTHTAIHHAIDQSLS